MIARAVLFILLLAAPPVKADPIPQDMLDQNYAGCMRQMTLKPGISDQQRQAYCQCIRDGLAHSVNADTYFRFGLQNFTGANPQQAMSVMSSLYNDCMEKVLTGSGMSGIPAP